MKKTPLNLAAKNGHTDVVEYLVLKGAKKWLILSLVNKKLSKNKLSGLKKNYYIYINDRVFI